MMKKTWLILLGLVLLAGSQYGVATAQAAEDGAAMEATALETRGTPAEVEAGLEEYCGICEAKKQFRDVTPWLDYGFDNRLRYEYHKNNRTLDGDTAIPTPAGERNLSEFSYIRNRMRLWTRVTPVEDFDINARLVYEFFHFCRPDFGEGFDPLGTNQTINSNVTFDILNITWNNILGMPMKGVFGRQDIRLGDGWLVFEGTPLDGSRTVYFDALRLITELEDIDTTVDLIYIENRARPDMYIKPFNDIGVGWGATLAETDERGIIAYVTNKSMENTQVDGYFIWKHDQDTPNDDTIADIYTFGARLAGDLDHNWKYRAEAAMQFGHRDDDQICGALGVNSQMTYQFHDAWKSDIHFGYEYRSGGEDSAENFDPLWSRYPYFSNVIQGQLDRIETVPGAFTNFHRFNVGWSAQPMEPITVLLDYHMLFRDRANDDLVSGSSLLNEHCLRGNLLTGLMKYRINEHLSGHLVAEWFIPGGYYENSSGAFFGRYELVFSW